MKKFLTVILWFSCLPFMYADSQGMQNTEIAGVKNGELREAVASWWGFNSGDATECLQKAIDSGVKKLIVDNTGWSDPFDCVPVRRSFLRTGLL